MSGHTGPGKKWTSGAAIAVSATHAASGGHGDVARSDRFGSATYAQAIAESEARRLHRRIRTRDHAEPVGEDQHGCDAGEGAHAGVRRCGEHDRRNEFDHEIVLVKERKSERQECNGDRRRVPRTFAQTNCGYAGASDCRERDAAAGEHSRTERQVERCEDRRNVVLDEAEALGGPCSASRCR